MMMGDDELGERRPAASSTPTIALGLAAVLLLIVGAMSYRDSVRNKYEREYAAKEQALLSRHGYPAVDPATGLPVGPYVAPGTPAEPVAPVAAAPEPLPADRDPRLVAESAAARGVESGLPRDPELDSIRSSLDQAQQLAQQTREQYREISDGVDGLAARERPSILPDDYDVTEELPAFLREALENPPGDLEGLGDIAQIPSLESQRARIVQAPSIGKVLSYDTEWGMVTISAGRDNQVQSGTRFAVRRGEEIVGWVRVEEVFDNQSIAHMVTRNREDDLAKKPEPGDDLIAFELF